GTAEEMIGLESVYSLNKSGWISKPDVFGCHPYDTPGEVERVLACVKHPSQPVEGRVRIASPDAFMEGGNEVEVFLARFVIMHGLAQQSLLCGFKIHSAY